MKKKTKPSITIVLPVFNEQQVLNSSIKQLNEYLNKKSIRATILIADDGSTDNTQKIAHNLQKEYDNINYIHHHPNQGRGAILYKAFDKSKTSTLIYTDADLAINLDTLPILITKINEGYDVATASKHHKDSKINYGILRTIMSKTYSHFARTILRCRVKDYQCGMKALTKKAFNRLKSFLTEKAWAFDTQLIALAYHANMKIKEVPATIINTKRKSTVNIPRDTIRMLASLKRIKSQIKKINFQNI